MKLLLSSAQKKQKCTKTIKILNIRAVWSFLHSSSGCMRSVVWKLSKLLVSVCCWCDEHIPPQIVKLIWTCPSCCSYVVNQLYQFFEIMINKLNVKVEIIFSPHFKKCLFKTYFSRLLSGRDVFQWLWFITFSSTQSLFNDHRFIFSKMLLLL